jgi:hypothetical protein
LQNLNLADGSDALQLSGSIEYGDAGRVIAAVLESSEALD